MNKVLAEQIIMGTTNFMNDRDVRLFNNELIKILDKSQREKAIKMFEAIDEGALIMAAAELELDAEKVLEEVTPRLKKYIVEYTSVYSDSYINKVLITAMDKAHARKICKESCSRANILNITRLEVEDDYIKETTK